MPREASTGASPLCRKTTCCKSAGRGSLCYPLPVPPEVMEDCATIGLPLPWKHRKHRRLYPGYILAISCEIDGVLSGPRLSAAQARARSRERLCGYLRSLKECVLFFVRRQAPFYPCFVWFSSTKHGIYIRFERGELNKLNSENEG